MGADATTQDKVLEAIAQRLRNKVEEFNDAGVCFFSDQQFPLKPPPGDLFCTVAAGDGVFPEDKFSGGGDDTLTENSTVDITVFRKALSQQPGKMDEALLSSEKGLIKRFKPRILRAMFKDAWDPVDGDGVELLRDYLFPIRAERPNTWREQYVYLRLTIGANFDWSL